MEGSIAVPLEGGINSSGFTVAAHPKRPTLYITGITSYSLSLTIITFRHHKVNTKNVIHIDN